MTGYAKALAARWAGRRSPSPPEAVPEWPRSVAITALEPEPDGTGTWLAAGLVKVHDEVNAAGCWYAVTGTDVTAPHGGQSGRVVLYFDGRSEPVSYLTLVYARDAAGGAR
jgi:hypothetical protein